MSKNCDEIKSSFKTSIAINDQLIISRKIDLKDSINLDIKNKVFASVDASYQEDGTGIGVAVAFNYPDYDIVDCYITKKKVCIPYIPGLLAFREMYLIVPSLLKLLKKIKPYAIFVDGHGYAHPRFAGIATHIGVAFNMPSIGVAKKRLTGEEVSIGKDLYLKIGDKFVAKVLFIKNKKIYISPGNKISLESSYYITKLMVSKFNLPIPIYIADKISKIAKNRIENNLDSDYCKKLVYDLKIK